MPVLLYRAHLGWLLGRRFLMLTHVGRRTGREYRTVVEVVGVLPASGEYVVVSGFGRSADWFRNVMAGGGRQVTVGRHHFSPEARELGEDEGAAVIARYERRHRLATPLLRGLLSRLVGWRYTGADDARRAQAIAEQIDHRGWTATALRARGVAHQAAGDLDLAEQAFHRSLAASKQLPLFTCWAHARLADVLVATGRVDQAEHHVRSLAPGPALGLYEARLAAARLATARRSPDAAAGVSAAATAVSAGGHGSARELADLLAGLR